MDQPTLVMNDLKSGVQKGQVALAVLTGATYFSNFEIRTTPDAAWERRLPPMPPGTLTKWSLSPSYDALERNLERPLPSSESDVIGWQNVEAEPPGFVSSIVIVRARIEGLVCERLFEAPGTPAGNEGGVCADQHQLRPRPGEKALLGYSDDASVFLNGKILFRGRSAQNYRDPGFLGIVNPENDAIYLRLKKGNNELMLAVSELGGGWGFICRLAEVEN